MRNTNPTSAPAVRPPAEPRATPTPTTAETVNALKTSPDGNKNAPMKPARINESARCLATNLVRDASTGPAPYARTVSAPVTSSVTLPKKSAFKPRALPYASTRWRCTERSTSASGAATANAMIASNQSYESITAATITISALSRIHASPPQEKNSARVSTSEVTRATSAPRRSSL